MNRCSRCKQYVKAGTVYCVKCRQVRATQMLGCDEWGTKTKPERPTFVDPHVAAAHDLQPADFKPHPKLMGIYRDGEGLDHGYAAGGDIAPVRRHRKDRPVRRAWWNPLRRS